MQLITQEDGKGLASIGTCLTFCQMYDGAEKGCCCCNCCCESSSALYNTYSTSMKQNIFVCHTYVHKILPGNEYPSKELATENRVDVCDDARQQTSIGHRALLYCIIL